MKAYIIHVSTAIEREKHITNELMGKSLDIVFVNEGDIKDLSETVQSKYFEGELSLASVSCSYKHLIACKKILAGNDDYALILEDDIYFTKK